MYREIWGEITRNHKRTRHYWDAAEQADTEMDERYGFDPTSRTYGSEEWARVAVHTFEELMGY